MTRLCRNFWIYQEDQFMGQEKYSAGNEGHGPRAGCKQEVSEESYEVARCLGEHFEIFLCSDPDWFHFNHFLINLDYCFTLKKVESFF